MNLPAGIRSHHILIITAINILFLAFEPFFFGIRPESNPHTEQLLPHLILQLGFTTLTSLIAGFLSSYDISSRNLFRKITNWLIASMGVFLISWLGGWMIQFAIYTRIE